MKHNTSHRFRVSVILVLFLAFFVDKAFARIVFSRSDQIHAVKYVVQMVEFFRWGGGNEGWRKN